MLTFIDRRLITELSAGKHNKHCYNNSPRLETEPGIADCLDLKERYQATGRVADAMHEHGKENTLIGMIEKPRPEKSQGDEQTCIGGELRQVKGAFKDRSRNVIGKCHSPCRIARISVPINGPYWCCRRGRAKPRQPGSSPKLGKRIPIAAAGR